MFPLLYGWECYYLDPKTSDRRSKLARSSNIQQHKSKLPNITEWNIEPMKMLVGKELKKNFKHCSFVSLICCVCVYMCVCDSSIVCEFCPTLFFYRKRNDRVKGEIRLWHTFSNSECVLSFWLWATKLKLVLIPYFLGISYQGWPVSLIILCWMCYSNFQVFCCIK